MCVIYVKRDFLTNTSWNNIILFILHKKCVCVCHMSKWVYSQTYLSKIIITSTEKNHLCVKHVKGDFLVQNILKQHCLILSKETQSVQNSCVSNEKKIGLIIMRWNKWQPFRRKAIYLFHRFSRELIWISIVIVTHKRNHAGVSTAREHFQRAIIWENMFVFILEKTILVWKMPLSIF